MSAESTFERTIITGALPYANGHIHLGTLRARICLADIFARFKRLCGHPMLYICGSDEYGVPITLTALKEGISPRRSSIATTRPTTNRLPNSASRSISTAGPRGPFTRTRRRRFPQPGHNGGHIEKQKWSSGIRTVRPVSAGPLRQGDLPQVRIRGGHGRRMRNCGAQYSANDLIGPKANIPGDCSTPILKKTVHWFLRLQDFTGQLKTWLDGHPEWRANVKGIAYSWVGSRGAVSPATRTGRADPA